MAASALLPITSQPSHIAHDTRPHHTARRDGQTMRATHQQRTFDEEDAEHWQSSDEQPLLLRADNAAAGGGALAAASSHAVEMRSAFSASSASSSSSSLSPCALLIRRCCLDSMLSWRLWPGWVRRLHPYAVLALGSLGLAAALWLVAHLLLLLLPQQERTYPPHIYHPHPASDWTVLSSSSAPSALSHVNHLDSPLVSLPAPAPPLHYSAAQAAASLTIVTAASDAYGGGLFLSLENLLGSVHAHAPNHRVLVYDLGLTPEQALVLEGYMNVQVVPMHRCQPRRHLSQHSQHSHLTDWKLAAFKPIIMLDALTRINSPQTDSAAPTAAAVPGSQAILYLDADMELTSYPALVERLLEKDGYVFAAASASASATADASPLNQATEAMAQFLQTQLGTKLSAAAEDADTRRVSTAFMAFASHSPAVESVLRPAAKCACEIQCISPPSSSSAAAAAATATSSLFSLLVAHSSSSSSSEQKLRVSSELALRGDRARVLDQTLEQLEGQVVYHRGGPASNSPSATFSGDGQSVEEDELSARLEWGASLPYTDSLLRRTRLALVVPFVLDDLDQIRAQWAANLVFSPCTLPTANVVDLVFFFSGGPNATLAAELRRLVDGAAEGPVGSAYAQVRACFRQVVLQYARLSAQEDIYPAGPTFMFDRLLAHPDVRLRARGYTHFLLHEADNRPVRQKWLDRIYDIVRPPNAPVIPAMMTTTTMTMTQPSAATTPTATATVSEADPSSPSPDSAALGVAAAAVASSSSLMSVAVAVAPFPYASSEWWLTGSLYRGTHDTGGWLLHINGNALYSLSSTFVSYASLVWRHLPLYDYAYDGALTHYLWGSGRKGFRQSPRQHAAQRFWHRFRFTDTVQNCWHNSCGPPQHIVTDSPNTVLIHTSANIQHTPPPPPTTTATSNNGGSGGSSSSRGVSGSALLCLFFLLLVVVAAFVWRRKKVPLA